MPPKKKITIIVDAEIAEEFKMQLDDWVNDFYGDEASRIEIGDTREI